LNHRVVRVTTGYSPTAILYNTAHAVHYNISNSTALKLNIKVACYIKHRNTNNTLAVIPNSINLEKRYMKTIWIVGYVILFNKDFRKGNITIICRLNIIMNFKCNYYKCTLFHSDYLNTVVINRYLRICVGFVKQNMVDKEVYEARRCVKYIIPKMYYENICIS